MKTTNTQKGFTLVELAIVMTIIGLLIGGILKGQELMQNARVTSTIAQVRAYEAATTTFRDKYDAVPGDMANAATRIPGCAATCNPAAGAPANAVVGDGIVGNPTSTFATQTAPLANNETLLYWTHLLLADLISGVTNTGMQAAPVLASGESHPAARIGGNFVVGNGSGVAMPGNALAGSGPNGMILGLVNGPTGAMNATAGVARPLPPTRAAQIDRKMDDGRANGGYVQAYGSAGTGATNCSDGAGVYNEAVTVKDCGLAFRIQG
jgi:prepilin-type N-terminal cleavage/methylation domain-containing protein